MAAYLVTYKSTAHPEARTARTKTKYLVLLYGLPTVVSRRIHEKILWWPGEAHGTPVLFKIRKYKTRLCIPCRRSVLHPKCGKGSIFLKRLLINNTFFFNWMLAFTFL
jgi:hypothetical protein